MGQNGSLASQPRLPSMASPSPFFTSNQDSLFVSPSPDPSARSLSNQWERPSAPRRNPSYTLPPPIPSIPRQNSQRQHLQPDPTLYQNQWFSGQASGSKSAARQQGAQAQQAPREENNNYRFYTQAEAQQPYQDQVSEPRLPSPSFSQATIENLTPSHFNLPNGENYLTSTPNSGWNFNDIDFSDGLDLVPDPNSNSNFNSNNNNNNNNNDGGTNYGFDHFDLFHPNWNGGIDPFASPPPPPSQQAQESPQEAVQPPYEAQAQPVQPWYSQRLDRGQPIDLTRTAPSMPRETANSRKRAAPASGASANGGVAASRNMRSRSASNNNEISPPPAKRKKVAEEDRELNDLFGSPGKEGEDEVDLVGVNDDEEYERRMKERKEEEVMKNRREEQEKPIRLAQQQCVICLDQPEGLTVTHCGHMFCAECLHGALNTNMMGKKVCPVCRSNINTNKTKHGAIPKTGVYHMEMKLQTRKQGKMPKKV